MPADDPGARTGVDADAGTYIAGDAGQGSGALPDPVAENLLFRVLDRLGVVPL
ncbi:hypothetical protein [Streptomyces sp. NPDC005930]|uniref:hypothetical protein n=1 Tax=Streptomyces sp. NPDC005930 TaxID=3364736 RepID=UPI003691ADA8